MSDFFVFLLYHIYIENNKNLDRGKRKQETAVFNSDDTATQENVVQVQ